MKVSSGSVDLVIGDETAIPAIGHRLVEMASDPQVPIASAM